VKKEEKLKEKRKTKRKCEIENEKTTNLRKKCEKNAKKLNFYFISFFTLKQCEN
jgi:hypothetical protein